MKAAEPCPRTHEQLCYIHIASVNLRTAVKDHQARLAMYLFNAVLVDCGILVVFL